MRILHVVTLISPDGAYGGPVRVALNQAAELRARGHEVTIAAAARGWDQVPTAIADVPVRLFEASVTVPGTGFAGLRAPGMTHWLRAELPGYDVAHVHLARDLVTLPAARAALRAGIPLIVQPHGMIDASSRLLARPLDRWWTVPVLRAAAATLHLTARERDDLIDVAGDTLALEELPNGVPMCDLEPVASEVPEVLFLARLHPRKRPDMFVAMAQQLLSEGLLSKGTVAKFSLVGADEGAAPTLDDEPHIRLEGPVAPADVAGRMARAAVYVLPSVDEPFPMSVLEAMAIGVPVVVTESCGLAPLIAETGSGRVVGHDLASLTTAVGELLADPTRAAAIGTRGRDTVRTRLSMQAVADRLEEIYRKACRR